MAPTGAPAPQPLFELCLWDDRFSWEFLQTPNSCHTHLSWAEWACVCVYAYDCVVASVRAVFSVCISLWLNVRVTHIQVRELMQVYQGMRSISLPVTHVAHRANTFCIDGENLNICRISTSKVPKQGTQSLGGPPKSAPCHLFCASLTFCLSYMNVFSPRLPSLHTLSSSCPSFLAAVEVTFINGEFMCMTAPKPELWLHHPRRLSVNSCNHQSAKYLPFRAHQPCTRWLGVIYRIKNISSSVDLHWYWYSVISSWLRFP